ncbi:MAG: CHAT domain-containing protein [Verrucomicrobia bacterium]|nr:CHAT domain-containing protein [Verrucomicrobiota bacterium]
MSSELTFIPPERSLSVSGNFHQLIDFIRGGEWDRGDYDAIALHALFSGGWYVFKPRILGQRARRFFELEEAQQTLESFQDIFDIHEYRALPQATRDTQPATPSLVLTPSHQYAGAWIAVTARRRSAKPPMLEGGDRGSSTPKAPIIPLRRGVSTSGPGLEMESRRGSPEMPARSPSTRRGRPKGGAKATLPESVAALDTAAEPLHRTPHMNLSAKPPFAPQTEFEVEVYADDQAPAEGEETEGITLAGNEAEYTLIVWLAPSQEFTVVGDYLRPLVIKRSETRSSSAKFLVRVADDAKEGRLAALTASFSYQGRPCGRVTRTLLIGTAGTKATTAEKKRERDFKGSITVESEPPPPADLTIVVACPDGEADRDVVTVTSPLLDAYKNGVAKPWKLREAAGALVRSMLANFVKEGQSTQKRLANLVGAGRNLFDAAPEHFRDAFWQLVRDKVPLSSIYIMSEEPHIPWELMVPNPQGTNIDGRKWRPLGVEYAMGRWVHEGHVSPPGAVTVGGAFVLAPDYTGTSQAVLAKAKAEAAFVHKQFGGTAFEPVNFDAVSRRIGDELTPLFHFVGHGAVTEEGDDETIYLEGDETLSTTEVVGLDGFLDGFRKTRPLVFFNACEVGRSVPALVGSGGFPRTFVKLGASAVIAPLWSVEDDCAHDVATTLYKAVRDDANKGVKPRPVAEILQSLRARTYDQGDHQGTDSFAAYCFYGDPSFVLKLPPAASESKPVRGRR